MEDSEITSNRFLSNKAKYGGGIDLEKCTKIYVSGNYFE